MAVSMEVMMDDVIGLLVLIVETSMNVQSTSAASL